MLLRDIAHSRTGDKGNISNISVIAKSEKYWPLIVKEITEEVVADHFENLILGDVVRFILPNIQSLNFVLFQSLGGGVTQSLALDAHGKCFSSVILEIEIFNEDLINKD
ncbi:MAG: hypothetical protein COB24_02090 [Hyphomicrobiales bacterium]|nr:MAG: hypothetical protein COB24_02090 [Hyphomicrobiales bacterium]